MPLNLLGYSPGFLTMILDSMTAGDEIRIFENAERQDDSPVDHNNFKITFHPFNELPAISGNCFIGAGKPESKEKLVKIFNLLPGNFINIFGQGAVISESTKIGRGCFIGPNSVVAGQTRIGNFVTVNRLAGIGHHTEISDFVTINPSASIAGKVFIGESTTVGMGAMVIDNIRIGCNCFIGAGSVVTRDIPDHTFFSGNGETARSTPARKK